MPDAATIMAKTAAAFLRFLEEAALFYKRLVMQLQVGAWARFGEGVWTVAVGKVQGRPSQVQSSPSTGRLADKVACER